MTIDIVAKKRRLQRMRGLAALAWTATTFLFLIPFYQWWKLGHVPFDVNFAALTIANVILVVISAKITRKIKFLRYQIAYFSAHEGES